MSVFYESLRDVGKIRTAVSCHNTKLMGYEDKADLPEHEFLDLLYTLGMSNEEERNRTLEIALQEPGIHVRQFHLNVEDEAQIRRQYFR
jgi:hypothetical protein